VPGGDFKWPLQAVPAIAYLLSLMFKKKMQHNQHWAGNFENLYLP